MGAIAIADRDAASPPAGFDLEARIVAAGLRCVARWGVAKTTLDDIAREAGCGRASVYRAFPGGREAVLAALVRAEVARVREAVAAAVAAAHGLEAALVAAVVATVRAVRASDALAFVLDHEPELVRPAVAFERFDAVLAAAADVAAPWFEPSLARADARHAVEWLVRLVCSHLFLPNPAVDLGDPEVARRVVRAFVLPGLEACSPPSDPSARTHPTH